MRCRLHAPEAHRICAGVAAAGCLSPVSSMPLHLVKSPYPGCRPPAVPGAAWGGNWWSNRWGTPRAPIIIQVGQLAARQHFQLQAGLPAACQQKCVRVSVCTMRPYCCRCCCSRLFLPLLLRRLRARSALSPLKAPMCSIARECFSRSSHVLAIHSLHCMLPPPPPFAAKGGEAPVLHHLCVEIFTSSA